MYDPLSRQFPIINVNFTTNIQTLTKIYLGIFSFMRKLKGMGAKNDNMHDFF